MEIRVRYATDYFTFHARQRTTFFNFFVLSVGLIVNGVAYSYRFTINEIFPIALLILGAFMSLAFYFLDRRNVILLESAEDVMRPLEQEMFKGSFSILYREKFEKNYYKSHKYVLDPSERKYFFKRCSRLLKHDFWIPLIQWAALLFFLGMLFLVSTGYLKTMESDINPKDQIQQFKSSIDELNNKLNIAFIKLNSFEAIINKVVLGSQSNELKESNPPLEK